MSDAGSPSLEHPEYWWYRARSELLEQTLQDFVGVEGTTPRILDVGSADGPSVQWLRERGDRIAMDVDPRGLRRGDVCASALSMPFASCTFDVVAGFDVVEHCEPEERVLSEISRVLVPGGRFLMSVPAYEWAWTSHDDRNHHHRRYTKRRAVSALSEQGFEIMRATYLFAGTFPLFAAERLARRVKERGVVTSALQDGQVPDLPQVGRRTEQVLMALTAIDGRLLRTRDLPFGSSVVVAARKPMGAPLVGKERVSR